MEQLFEQTITLEQFERTITMRFDAIEKKLGYIIQLVDRMEACLNRDQLSLTTSSACDPLVRISIPSP